MPVPQPDEVFLALSNPVRRKLLEVLAEGPRSAGDLAGLFDLSRPAVAEHLRVLRAAGLVRDEPSGRHRHYHLTAEPLSAVDTWLRPFEQFWRARLRSLADAAEEIALSGSIDLDQFVAAPPHVVWTLLTDPGHHARWWAPGDISAEVGHRFHLAMPGFGEVPCVVLESEQDKRLSYSFNGNWTITWTLTPVAGGTTLHLTHSGFDLDDHRQRDAHDRMSPGWRDTVLPRLAAVAESL